MTGPVVIDASAAMRLVMRADGAPRLAERLESATIVTAPAHFATEVANALWKYARSGAIDLQSALERRDEALGLVERLVPDHELGAEALAEAHRTGHPFYDLLYAVLARRTGCGVLTTDDRLRSLLRRLEIPATE